MCASGDGTLKFLRVADNQFKPIQHNMKRESQHYLCHCWLPEDRFVLAADNGDLLLFEGFEFRATLARPTQMPPPANSSAEGGDQVAQQLVVSPNGPIHALMAFSKGFVCGCADGVLCVFERADDSREVFRCAKIFCIEGNASPITNLAVSPSEETLCCATANCQMYTFTLSNSDILKDDTTSFELLLTAFHGPGPSGSARINAIDVCIWKPLVATCGDDQTLRIWNYQERSVELIKKYDEEILAVALHPSGLLALAGFADKIRLVSLLMDDVRTVREMPVIKGCRECRFANGGHIFAIANNTTVHILGTYTCETLAILRGHSSRVKSIQWSRNDRRLTSVGADGAVVVWKVREANKEAEHVISRLSYHAAVATPDLAKVYVVADDESLRELAPATGTVTKTKTLQVRPTCLEVSATQRLLFVGIPSSDSPSAPGVVQVHCLLGAWEEAEPRTYHCAALDVSCLQLSTDGSLLFAGGADGSLCIFEVRDVDQRGVARAGRSAATAANVPQQPETAGQPKVIVEEILVTKSDIQAKSTMMQELSNKVDELTLNNEYQLRLKDMKYKDRIEEITDKFSAELEEDAQRCAHLAEEKRKMELMYEANFGALDEKHKLEVAELERTYEAKIQAESKRFELLVQKREAQTAAWEEENRDLVDDHEKVVRRITGDYDAKIEEEHESQKQLAEEKEAMTTRFTQTKDIIEEDADMEVLEVKHRYEAKLVAERELTAGLKDENVHMKKRHSALTKDVDDQKEEIRSLLDKEKELLEAIKGLEKDIQGHKKEIREREETIADKEKRIYDLKKKNQELEKFKFVLDYKIKELKRQIEPRETEIADMRKQVEEMDLELEQYHKSNAALDLMIGELRLKMDGMQHEIDQQKRVQHEADAHIVRFRHDLADCAAALPDKPKDLKARVRDLYTVYVLKEAPASTRNMSAATKGPESSTDLHAEYNRHREHLERNIDALKRKIARDLKMYVDDRARLVDESSVLVDEMNKLRRESHALQLKQETVRSHMAALGHEEGGNDDPALDEHLHALEARAEFLQNLLSQHPQQPPTLGDQSAFGAEPTSPQPPPHTR